ncbi:alpha/beta fold hydrolase, partial [Acrocarpospora corrugata]
GIGGHSLQVVQVVGRLRKLGVTVTARELLQTQTVAGVAARSAAPTASQSSLVVELNPGKLSESAKSVFCLHPGGGSARWYIPLAEQIGADVRIFGVEAVGLHGEEPPLHEIGEMADRYWREIRAVQPDGPYFVVGWSYGAIVAQEMARRHGDQMQVVILIEPPVLEGHILHRMHQIMDGYQSSIDLWERGQTTIGAERHEIEEKLRSLADRLEVPREAVTLDEWLPYQTLWLLYKAAVEHRPRPSKAKTLLLVGDEVRGSSDGSDYNLGTYQDYLEYWGDLCVGEFRVVDAPGPHLEMLASGRSLDVLIQEILDLL